jgi:cell shape-determining protein MreD
LIIISFIIDGILSKYIPSFISLFSLAPLMLKTLSTKEDILIKWSLIVGIIYDITYTDTLILNGLLFFSLIQLLYQSKFKEEKNFLLMVLLIYIIYFSAIIMLNLLFQNITFHTYLFKLFFKSLFINYGYFFILYCINKKKNHIVN